MSIARRRLTLILSGLIAIGCAKQFVVEYRCSGGQPSKRVTVAAEAGLGGIASLGCP